MQKITLIILTILLCVSLVACNSQKKQDHEQFKNQITEMEKTTDSLNDNFEQLDSGLLNEMQEVLSENMTENTVSETLSQD